MRRLNRTEYRLTIRDLLHLDVSSFDPSREFPEDTRVHASPATGRSSSPPASCCGSIWNPQSRL
ncbi:DUF1587 domain-containing protein [Verrucomicrobium spinosum]|uniref:DUF1587 domain-containing protein n=1 Tax=Verrucomicrobium spinosum TaxID=2736 RepID=UPI0009EBB8E0|nr:DUF1587 domain-containing protein [Verrucomicrobium spinosum]